MVADARVPGPSFSMQHSLPRMIHRDGIGDPADWLLDRRELHPMEDNVLGPALTICRLLGLCEGLMDLPAGCAPDLRLLNWLEAEGDIWRQKWLGPHSHFQCLPHQAAFMQFCLHVYRLQLAEVSLLFLLRSVSSEGLDPVTAVAKQVLAFGVCTDAAMAVLNAFTLDLCQTLPMAQDAVFIGA